MQLIYKCKKCGKFKIVFDDDIISGCHCDDCFIEMDYVDECRSCKDCEYKIECR